MTQQCDLHLISKLRADAALFWHPTQVQEGRGRPAIYGKRFNPQQIEQKYRTYSQVDGNIRTEIYQMNLTQKVPRTTQRRLHPQDKLENKTAVTCLIVQF